MTNTYAMAPKQALEVIEATGAEDPTRLIADHASAGLLRSYAQIQQTIDAQGERTVVRGGRVLPAIWERMIGAGVHREAWTGGTVRLAGSDLIGGARTVHVTGFAFHPADVERLANQQSWTPQRAAKRQRMEASIDTAVLPTPQPKSRRRAPDLSPLHAGALLLTVEQVKAALAIGHTTAYKLINEGKLERPDGETRVTAASVRRYAGIVD